MGPLRGELSSLPRGAVLLDEAHHGHRPSEARLDRYRAAPAQLAQHRCEPARIGAVEQLSRGAPHIGRGAHQDHVVARAMADQDARLTRQVGGEAQLRRMAMAGQGREPAQVVEVDDPVRRAPFDQQMEQVDGGRSIFECTVRRAVLEREPLGERAEPAVVGVVARQTSGERHGVDHVVGAECRPAGPCERRVQEPQVELDVVPGDHRVADELEQRRQHRIDVRPAAAHQGVERAQPFAAAHDDRADLGDLVPVRVGAGGLEVEHAERDAYERHVSERIDERGVDVGDDDTVEHERMFDVEHSRSRRLRRRQPGANTTGNSRGPRT